MTQGAMFALLTCFHHHSVLWVFTVVSVGPLGEWSECLGFRRWEHQRTPSQSWLLAEMVQPDRCTVLSVPGSLSDASTPRNSQWSFQELREGSEIQGNFMEMFEFPRVPSLALSLHLPFLLTDEPPEAQE